MRNQIWYFAPRLRSVAPGGQCEAYVAFDAHVPAIHRPAPNRGYTVYPGGDGPLSRGVPEGQGDKKYEVEVFVRNVENKDIKANANVYMVQNVPYPLAVYQPPRTWGVKLRYHF